MLNRRSAALADDPIWGPSGASVADKALPLLWFDDIEPVLDCADFVQGLLIEQSAIVIYGDSNAGKTFWTTDLALHIAAGHDFCGRRVEQSGVVYCVLEGGHGFRNRVAAWKQKRGLGDYSIPFAAIPSQLNLLSPTGDVDRLIQAIKAAQAAMSVPLRLVVIDTLSRALAGGNENAPEDMGALVQNMDLIRAETGAAVLFVHHSGKDQAKGARGHSLLRAAIDTEIEVVADDTSPARTATVVKQRETSKGQVFAFTLETFELGNNRHGEPMTTCLVVHSDAPAGAALRQTRLSGDPKRGLEILNNLVCTHGRAGFAGTPSFAVSVPEKWWRDRFYDEAKPGATPEAKQKAFRRASDTLIERRIVAMATGRVWVADNKAPQGFNTDNDTES